MQCYQSFILDSAICYVKTFMKLSKALVFTGSFMVPFIGEQACFPVQLLGRGSARVSESMLVENGLTWLD